MGGPPEDQSGDPHFFYPPLEGPEVRGFDRSSGQAFFWAWRRPPPIGREAAAVTFWPHAAGLADRLAARLPKPRSSTLDRRRLPTYRLSVLQTAHRGLGEMSAAAPPRSSQPVNPWPAVDALIDRAPDLAALQAHRLHLLAAQRWRKQGKLVPPWLADAERGASVQIMLAALVLERVRSTYDGRIVLFKGYEVGQSYPSPSLRPFVDIDLLVDDAERAQAALLAAGF